MIIPSLEKKTEHLNLMISKSTKRKLKEKANYLGLKTITSLIEKFANEPVIFPDEKLIKMMKSMPIV